MKPVVTGCIVTGCVVIEFVVIGFVVIFVFVKRGNLLSLDLWSLVLLSSNFVIGFVFVFFCHEGKITTNPMATCEKGKI